MHSLRSMNLSTSLSCAIFSLIIDACAPMNIMSISMRKHSCIFRQVVCPSADQRQAGAYTWQVATQAWFVWGCGRTAGQCLSDQPASHREVSHHRFMKRYNCGRPHMPPDTTIEEIPAAAFKRKMPPPETEPAYDRLPPCDNGFLCKAGCWHHLRCIANTSTHRYNRFRPLVRRHMRLQQNRTMKTSSPYGRYAAHTDRAYLP